MGDIGTSTFTEAEVRLGREAWLDLWKYRAEDLVARGNLHCATMRAQTAEAEVKQLRGQLETTKAGLECMQDARDEALAESCGLRVENERLKNEGRRAKRLLDLTTEIRVDLRNYPGVLTPVEVLDAAGQAYSLEHEGPFLPLRCRLKSRKGGRKK